MDADSWSARLSSASKRYQSALQSRSDMFMGFEEIEADDDIRDEYPCPFCSEYFDIVGLCCHIDDEHPVEAKNGVCPVCAMRVGVDMRKRKSRKAEVTSLKKSTTDNVPERIVQAAPLSVKDHEERTRRSEFVQGMLLSTILDDNL
ncbi:hypothetical protein POM88_030224 [Heracleum sosnowskyi]|uniref:Drought induced 19 protein type zinc-binding domain-containing protein n=1 Tax=Heracleum sosnowskyi TaxID=360622 RepID=A0AAD8HVK4_9APIA|nr:hypothetical protein POM88_030224 [Heracleum sosnowskyi]